MRGWYMMWKGAAVFVCCSAYVTVMVVMKMAAERHFTAGRRLYVMDGGDKSKGSRSPTPAATHTPSTSRSGCALQPSLQGGGNEEIIVCSDIKGSSNTGDFRTKSASDKPRTYGETIMKLDSFRRRSHEMSDDLEAEATIPSDDLPPLLGDVFNMIDSAKALSADAARDQAVSSRNNADPFPGKHVKNRVQGKPWDYSITLAVDQSHLCQSGDEEKPVPGPFLFILIHSHPSHRYRRNAIRDTWGGVVKNYTNVPRIVIGFLLGSPEVNVDGNRLAREISLYRDIIQYDFRDGYGNLTLKSVLALSWIHNFCPQAKFVLKTDDDVYFNISKLLGILTQERNHTLLMGSMNPSSQVQRFGQWKVREKIYPGPTYPPYCSGAAYVMSADVSDALYREHCKTAGRYDLLVPIEDVYVTGVLATKVGVTCKNNRYFPSWTTVPSPKSVFRFLRGDILGVHGLSHSGMYGLSKIVKQCRGCHSNMKVLRKWFSLLAGS